MSDETPSIAILNKQNCLFSPKTYNKKAKQVLFGGLVPVGEGRIRKRYRRVNMVEILCTHVCKWKNETC
jgi:hypothetical protein